MAAILLLGVPAPSGGCVGPPGAPIRDGLHPIAIRYSVEPLHLTSDSPADAMRRQLPSIRQLGFNAIFVSHLADDDRPALLDAARANDLAVILCDPVILHHVRSGADGGPAACRHLLRERLLPDVLRPPVILLYLGEAADAGTAARAAAVAEAVARDAPALPLAFGIVPGVAPSGNLLEQATPLIRVESLKPVTRSPRPGIVLIAISRRIQDADSVAGQWLNLYHAGLSAGGTCGLVVDAYAEVPGRVRGLVDENDRLTVDRAASIKRLVQRASRWGPLLHGMSPSPVTGATTLDPDIRMTLFARDRRRHVLVWNSSTTRFLRTTVSLPDRIGEGIVGRAVEVPGEPGVPGGHVLTPRRGRLDLAVDLAPGDAALYELF